MRNLLALGFLASTWTLAAASFDCKRAQVAGFVYDLSPLAGEITLDSNTTTPPTVTTTKYVINPCAPLKAQPDSVPAIDRCPENAWACRSVINYKKDEKPRVIEVNAVAGKGSKDEPVLEAKASGSEKPAEFHWIMAGAEVEKVAWSTDIKFVCNKGAKNQDLPKVVGFKDGTLSLEWSVPAACALGDDGKAPSGGDKDKDKDGSKEPSSSSGGGFFSTLFSLVVVVAGLYLVLGVMYKYLIVRASGLDLIPNRVFWREFPYLCSDFAQHVWGMVGGRRRGGYSVV
ncbi:type II membrane protein [Coemansia thaxteri]|uniref:Autophagy-related protein 27 n=1 Tax=Coemansia thaxteri TaxID=2663907 RepID=A0A9W8EMG9_9FUNG|nr:type II membrane protein [Coemansia thaxteri]KAJ2008628.1 type II membrane protein [Coemansia thaxteri]KAJ2472349.1 type II membrane protein [Coemansia sp. RSA 2322]KAJ2488126.1 type II membrane protein [Coemansia sp. RSA 2320]